MAGIERPEHDREEILIRAAFERGFETFMGVRVQTAPGALVPRQETELLGWTAVELLRPTVAPVVIDMCTGSGNLACGIASALPAATLWASDLTQQCVGLARQNVQALHLEDRITVVQGDLFESLKTLGLEGAVDVVVCNPPYISAGRLEKDSKRLLEHEPREAFDAGPYGLSIHKRLAADAAIFVKPGGYVCCEFGVGQGGQVAKLFERTGHYSDLRLVSNEANEPRVAVARRK